MGSQLFIRGHIQPRVRLHAGLDAGAAEEEAGGGGVVGGVGVVAFDPLAAGGVGGAAEGAGGVGAAVFKHELVGELGVAFEFAAAFGGEDFVGEVVAFEPLVERLNFGFVAEADPGAVVGIEEEAHIFEAFLNERIGPGGDLDGFPGRHVGGYSGGFMGMQSFAERVQGGGILALAGWNPARETGSHSR